tara:strand:- start:3883 stop:4272 length:390 start_codon:yes stop_codon:yes gene_type:complete
MILPCNWIKIKNKNVSLFYNGELTVVQLKNLSSIKNKCNRSSKDLANQCYRSYIRKTNNKNFTCNQYIGSQVSEILNTEYKKHLAEKSQILKNFKVKLLPNIKKSQGSKPCKKILNAKKVVTGFKMKSQ